MIAKISEIVKGWADFAKAHADAIILIAVVMLFILFSFALGYIIARYQLQEPIQVLQQ
ncbi:MAG: hypothetical protein Q7S10_03700 [bacterium]|nr:hypothetical protein [bacterium]